MACPLWSLSACLQGYAESCFQQASPADLGPRDVHSQDQTHQYRVRAAKPAVHKSSSWKKKTPYSGATPKRKTLPARKVEKSSIHSTSQPHLKKARTRHLLAAVAHEPLNLHFRGWEAACYSNPAEPGLSLATWIDTATQCDICQRHHFDTAVVCPVHHLQLRHTKLRCPGCGWTVL